MATPARIGSSPTSAIWLQMATTAATTGSTSTPTSMTPSPSHLSTRTPKRGAAARTLARSLTSSATAASSPLLSLKSVNPQRSMKAKVRVTRVVAERASAEGRDIRYHLPFEVSPVYPRDVAATQFRSGL